MSGISQAGSLCSRQHICKITYGLQRHRSRATPRRCQDQKCRRVYAVGWDPEGILAQPRGGHISRRNVQKQVAEDQQLQDQVEKERLIAREELQKKRAARQQPTSHAELVNYFMFTEADEMSFELSRCRPLITQEFQDYLADQISQLKFGSNPSEERVAELEGLQVFLKDGIAKVDAAAKEMAAPADRMRALLTAQDKKAALLELAGNNQIDKPLLDLLQQNIDAARSAGQEQPAAFMEKIKAAAQRYRLSS